MELITQCESNLDPSFWHENGPPPLSLYLSDKITIFFYGFWHDISSSMVILLSVICCSVRVRVTRERWPLLTVEAPSLWLKLSWMGNGDSNSTNVRGPALFGSLGSRRGRKRDFYPALAALVSPVQKFFFVTVHYFNFCVPIVQQHREGSLAWPLVLIENYQTYILLPDKKITAPSVSDRLQCTHVQKSINYQTTKSI